MTAEDLPFVVREHSTHFPDSLFARLGPKFLASYTTTYLAAPHARAYVAELAGHPCGFLIGTIDPPRHRRHLLRVHGPRLAALGFAALTRRPRPTLHFLWTRLGRSHGRPPRADSRRTAVLDYLVVAQQRRSRGVGAALIQNFVWDAARTECRRVSLCTAAGPEGAGAYYRRLGWRHTGERATPDGRRLDVYELALRQRRTATAQSPGRKRAG
ncbi:MAG: GNAT family N-acetyltransferase [Streptomyces sp.]